MIQGGSLEVLADVRRKMEVSSHQEGSENGSILLITLNPYIFVTSKVPDVQYFTSLWFPGLTPEKENQKKGRNKLVGKP